MGSIAPSGAPLFALTPSAEEFLALRTALLEGERAREAFYEWTERVDLRGDFAPDIFRLLPLMYHNLQTIGIDHPVMGRLKGVYRFAWCQNNTLFTRVKPSLSALAEAGIPTMLFKGAPFVHWYYKSHALRPMADVDILVHPASAPKATGLLEGLGWRPDAPTPPDLFRFRHAVRMENGTGAEIDLHWHCLLELAGTATDRFFWKSARPLDFGGVRTLAPDPTRALIVTILHGLRWNLTVPIRWIADATTILRRSEHDIAWDELVGFVKDWRFAYRVHLGLAYLREHFDAPVPTDVLEELNGGPTLVERIENTVVLQELRPVFSHPLGNLWIMFASYLRYGWRANPIAFLLGFSHYLRFRWGLRGRLEILKVFVRGVGKRILRLFRRQPASVA